MVRPKALCAFSGNSPSKKKKTDVPSCKKTCKMGQHTKISPSCQGPNLPAHHPRRRFPPWCSSWHAPPKTFALFAPSSNGQGEASYYGVHPTRVDCYTHSHTSRWFQRQGSDAVGGLTFLRIQFLFFPSPLWHNSSVSYCLPIGGGKYSFLILFGANICRLWELCTAKNLFDFYCCTAILHCKNILLCVFAHSQRSPKISIYLQCKLQTLHFSIDPLPYIESGQKPIRPSTV